jgi:hypothetical protein
MSSKAGKFFVSVLLKYIPARNRLQQFNLLSDRWDLPSAISYFNFLGGLQKCRFQFFKAKNHASRENGYDVFFCASDSAAKEQTATKKVIYVL